MVKSCWAAAETILSKRVLRGGQVEGFDTWEVPDVDASAAESLKGAETGAAHLLTGAQVDALTNKVEAEAFQGGYAEGLAAGQQELNQRLERLDSLFSTLARPYKDLDEQVQQELVSLAVTLARHILRRELKHDPNHVIGALRDCMEILPSQARDVTVHLNAADAALVKEYLQQSGSERAWAVNEDPTLEPGSLRVTSDSSAIDARLETRLSEIVGAAMGTGRGDTDA